MRLYLFRLKGAKRRLAQPDSIREVAQKLQALDRSSGSRIILLAAPSRPRFAPNSGQERAVYCARRAAFVPDHSGGTAPELHGVPFTPSRAPVSVATTDRIIAPRSERVKRDDLKGWSRPRSIMS